MKRMKFYSGAHFDASRIEQLAALIGKVVPQGGRVEVVPEGMDGEPVSVSGVLAGLTKVINEGQSCSVDFAPGCRITLLFEPEAEIRRCDSQFHSLELICQEISKSHFSQLARIFGAVYGYACPEGESFDDSFYLGLPELTWLNFYGQEILKAIHPKDEALLIHGTKATKCSNTGIMVECSLAKNSPQLAEVASIRSLWKVAIGEAFFLSGSRSSQGGTSQGLWGVVRVVSELWAKSSAKRAKKVISFDRGGCIQA